MLIVSWKPLFAAFWDSLKLLIVVKTVHMVVVGDVVIVVQVRCVACFVEKVVVWDFEFFGVVDKKCYFE